MPTLVHIADEKSSRAILRGGIRPHKGSSVFFMPVLQSHLVSHQWIRELRRRGSRVLVGVYFRLPTSEPVWAGRYNEAHRQVPLGEAIRELRSLADPLGYELFIERAVPASEIQRIRAVPATVGWRYRPHAHGRPLCGCPSCLPRGAINSRRLRERLDPAESWPSLPDVQQRLADGATPDEVADLLWALRKKRRRMDPAFLEPLATSDEASIREDVALTLAFFRHANARRLLERLAQDDDPDVSAAATDGVRKLDGEG